MRRFATRAVVGALALMPLVLAAAENNDPYTAVRWQFLLVHGSEYCAEHAGNFSTKERLAFVDAATRMTDDPSLDKDRVSQIFKETGAEVALARKVALDSVLYTRLQFCAYMDVVQYMLEQAEN